MIELEDIDTLAGLSPEQKFCAVEQLARRRLVESQSEAERASDEARQHIEPQYTEHDYASAVSAAAQEFGIVELADFDLPSPFHASAEGICRAFRSKATQLSQRLLFRHGTKNATVALDAITKEKIGHWLKQMREAVQAADVSAEKKDRLFALIDKLQAEVDRDRTPVHAAGELWLTVCTYAGEGTKNVLEPVMPYMERIASTFGLAKQAEDSQPTLPPRKEPKRIEGPKEPTGFDKVLDDEIPF